jgi:uncharacterized membrane protein YkvA (DUF1232 family)
MNSISESLARLRHWARVVKRDVHAVYLASRDPRVPWYAKLVALLVVAYALSPIDLIPDFIPILGYLDDLILVPLGVLLVIHLVPSGIMAEHRVTAEKNDRLPQNWVAATVIIMLWMAGIAILGWVVVGEIGTYGIVISGNEFPP